VQQAATEANLARIRGRASATTATATAVLLLGGALWLYVRTSAPSLLTGDQAEHQFTAYVVGVPHATGYPLFTVLNALAARLIPAGDVAQCVTLAVALYSALAVALAFAVGRRITGSSPAGLLAAVVLAVSPEFWALATIADVYTLQALLLLGLLLALLRWWDVEARQPDLGLSLPGLRHPLAAAGLLAGLGATHHGSFTPIVGPALLVTVAGPLLWRLRAPDQCRSVARLIGRCALWGLVGCTPWLYLAAQYILFRPFDDYRGQGLPYHPYWGNPRSWGDVFNLALGAGFRSKIFTQDWSHLSALPAYLRELRQQFPQPGVALGMLGAAALLWRSRRAGLFTLSVWLAGSFFGLSVAADVPKAHVYFLPAYVMWSLWVGGGGVAIARALARALPRGAGRVRPLVTTLALGLLLLPFVREAYPFGRRDLSGRWEYRHAAEVILDHVEPDAVILCRWEECMPLRYLQLVEGRKLGVQLDQSEPEDGSNWADRASIYVSSHPVYAVSYNPDLAERYRLFPLELDSPLDVFRVEDPAR
jgi:Protein O-mannosyl-transferase TMEM260-like